ncbi:MAG: hypothetical protein HKN67_05595 [Saprospiraceae bacterium]|nr:hypothetical protein [Bacteroidia bacterium]NNF21393.1 hypothetical protein [Saprospiraceae bacterium]
MISKFQISHKWKKFGWILLIPSLVLGPFNVYYEFEPEFLSVRVFAIFNEVIIFSNPEDGPLRFITNNILDELLAIGVIAGALIIILSRETDEDEYIRLMRQEAMFWAFIVNSILLLLMVCFIYGMSFLHVMIFNLFTPLILFVLRFQYVLYRSRHKAEAQ